MKKTKIYQKKMFYNWRLTERIRRQVGEVELQYSHVPHSKWVIHKWENNWKCRSSLQGVRGLSLTSDSPACGPCAGKMSPQSIWLWRSVGSFFLNYQRAGGNRDFTLKEHTQNLICSGTEERSINLIGTWVRPTCWSCRIFQGGTRQLQLTPRTHFEEFIPPYGQWYWQAPL